MSKALIGGIVVVLIAILYSNTGKGKPNIVSEHLKNEYDYIVVGAGSAGSVVAARLAEDPTHDILLLEAGGHFDESPLFHIPLAWGALEHTEYDWEYYTERQKNIFLGLKDKRSYWPRGKVVGGTSVLNVMQYTRGSPFDYNEWATNGCKGWDYKSVLPYFLKSEDIQIDELKSSPFHSQGGPLAVSQPPPSEITNSFLKAGQEIGYKETDYNGANQAGFSVVQSTVRDGVRSSTGLEYLGNKKKANLDLAIRSFVTKIEIQDSKAVGVYYIRNGRKQFAKARNEVILSAGAINSPQLLMLSGVGPKAHLEELGIPVKKDLPVGQYLKDHHMVLLPRRVNITSGLSTHRISSTFSQFMYALFKAGPLVQTGITGTAFLHFDKQQQGKAHPDVQIAIFNLLLGDNTFDFNETIVDELIEKDPKKYGITLALCLARPKSIGSLKLRSNDPFDPPVIYPGYFSNDEDMKSTIKGVRLMEQVMQTESFRKIGIDINERKASFCSQYEFRSDDYWECYIRHTSTTVYHHTSTCRMGSDNDPLAVVDPELKVKGIQNLRVVDASVFPDITAGNTNAPTIMIAEKAADMIQGVDTVKHFKNRL